MSVDSRPRKRAAVADPKAREFLRQADPILGRLIDAQPDFRPRAWLDELPPLDAFGTLVFQVIGQQLSVSATRTILWRLEQRFGGHLPSYSSYTDFTYRHMVVREIFRVLQISAIE